ncbi:MAG: Berberine and berberine like [Sporomusa sp.]|jgi:hypothetical protein|nr:Berberine and berberine like [Sporomusa sp.]
MFRISILRTSDRVLWTNFDKFREVKEKYDPENVVNFPQSIPPACSCPEKSGRK